MVINQLKTKKGYCLVLLVLAMGCTEKGNGQSVMNISDSLMKKLHVKTKIVTFNGDSSACWFNYDWGGKLKECKFGKSKDKNDCSTITIYTYDIKGNLVSEKKKYCDYSSSQLFGSPYYQEDTSYIKIVYHQYDNKSKLKQSYSLDYSGRLLMEKIYDSDSLKTIEKEYGFRKGEYSEITTYYEIKNLPKKCVIKKFHFDNKCYYSSVENYKNFYNSNHLLVKQESEINDSSVSINVFIVFEYYDNGLLKKMVYRENYPNNVLGDAIIQSFDYEYY